MVTETSQCTSSESKSSLSKFTTCSYSFLPPFFTMHHSTKQGFATLRASSLCSVLGTSILLHCKQLISILIFMESYKTILDDMKVGFCWSANLAEIMRVRRGLMIPEFVYLFLLQNPEITVMTVLIGDRNWRGSFIFFSSIGCIADQAK